MDHLVVTCTHPEATSSLLEEWIWLIGTEKRPVLIAACGDAFVEDGRDGSVHFLDVGAAELSPVAETAEAFAGLLSDPAFASAYLRTERIAMLRQQGLILKKDQVYSFRVPLSLGGEVRSENIEISDVAVHFSIAGQIERQIADLPEGAPITGIKIERIPGMKPWWKFW